MRIIYAHEPLPSETTISLYLMGPTSPVGSEASWRDEALRVLQNLGFMGEVFVPEPRDRQWDGDHLDQVQWEEAALQQADRILVWLPPDMQAMAGATTSDQWGYWKGRDPARLILAIPHDADHARCQQHDARQLGIPVQASLDDACRAAAADAGALRRDGECQVPLHLWRTDSFQAWYAAQKEAGNQLCGVRVEWIFRTARRPVLYWALHVDVFVAAESRHKTNEVIIGRPDVSVVVLYHPGAGMLDTEVVLVREFRSSSRTADGFIWELPGGSSERRNDALQTAVEELQQETGVAVDRNSLVPHEPRQLAGTVLTHHARVYSLRLPDAQIAELRRRAASQASYGNADETERTHLHVRSLREILADPRIDWSTLGIVLAVLHSRGDAELCHSELV